MSANTWEVEAGPQLQIQCGLSKTSHTHSHMHPHNDPKTKELKSENAAQL